MLLHDHPDFANLLLIVADQQKISPTLVEKDYWIMHCLWGLAQQGFQFELKGGTSLSKGYGLIARFSEDIDIHMTPPQAMDVKIGKNQDKPLHRASRERFYDWLSASIRIAGVDEVARDRAFDDEKLRSAGIRLHYQSHTEVLTGLKDGILLELGFDLTTPNEKVTISSWAFDYARTMVNELQDNRAIDVLCYSPAYTFVEKLQTISTKYRRYQQMDTLPANFLRHYYDVYCLLGSQAVQDFIGSELYEHHKEQRFGRLDEFVIARNDAFLLPNILERERFSREFEKTKYLYYQGQPSFHEIVERIALHIERL